MQEKKPMQERAQCVGRYGNYRSVCRKTSIGISRPRWLALWKKNEDEEFEESVEYRTRNVLWAV
jgi:hypothetical protein